MNSITLTHLELAELVGELKGTVRTSELALASAALHVMDQGLAPDMVVPASDELHRTIRFFALINVRLREACRRANVQPL